MAVDRCVLVRRGLAAIAVSLTASLPAQVVTTTVFPRGAATTMGGTFLAFPFSVDRGLTQSLMMASGFAPPRTGTIVGVAFRAPVGSATYPGNTLEIEVRFAPAATDPHTMSAFFAQNRAAPATVVLPRSLVSLPSLTSLPSGLTPFVVSLPFSSGYVWRGEDLVQEIEVYAASTPGRYDLDAAWVDRPRGTVTSIGQACAGSAGLPIHIGPREEDLVPGSVFGVQVWNAPPGSVALDALGTDTASWGSVPLPFVWPGTSCSIDTDVLLWQLAPVDATGRAAVPWVAPYAPAFECLTVYSQWAIGDGRNGAPPLITTNALELTLGTYPDVDFETVWTIGTSNNGMRDPDRYQGLVERLDLR